MSVQAYLSRVAADAIQIDTIRVKARDRGIENARLEYSYYKTQGRCRITCQPAIALVVLEELREAANNAREQAVRDACEEASRDVTAAIGHSARIADAPIGGFGRNS